MKFNRYARAIESCFYRRTVLLAALMTTLVVASIRLRADTGVCGGASITLPFTDVPSNNLFFCAIAEAYFSALTNGTSPTTYNPSAPVPREQMAAFITRTLDQSLKRGSKRAALHQFWTTQGANNLGLTFIGNGPLLVEADGADLWIAGGSTVLRVRASDGRLLETWNGATSAVGVLIAKGQVFITGNTTPGSLYQIDPTQPPGSVTTLSSSLGGQPSGIAYDGEKIWTADLSGGVSIIRLLNPVSVNTVLTGFTIPSAVLFDGANIWVTDFGDNTLKKLDGNGGILQSVSVGTAPDFPAFDGTNIWVPNKNSDSISVVRASSGTVLATLTGNGLDRPEQAAFDGERILVTNVNGNSVSLWKASDLSPIGTFSTGTSTRPQGVCSDGLNFWIALTGTNQLARF